MSDSPHARKPAKLFQQKPADARLWVRDSDNKGTQVSLLVGDCDFWDGGASTSLDQTDSLVVTEEFLYRHPGGAWTFVIKRWSADSPSDAELTARRLVDAAAVIWLQRKGHSVPHDLQALADRREFVPGAPPTPRLSDEVHLAKPIWNAERGELRLSDQLIRKVHGNAKNLRAILHGFQSEGWPESIESPLINDTGADDPLRQTTDAIRTLNAGLSFISFKRRERRIIWHLK